MKWEAATAEEFFAANSQTRCFNLINLARLEAGSVLFLAMGTFWQGTFETVEDFDLLKTTYIVRYKPNASGQGGWQYSGSSNYTAYEYAAALRTAKVDSKEREDILTLVDSLKDGLKKDVVLTAAMDNLLNARVIVDGNHRATAVALMLMEDLNRLGTVLESTHKIQILELRSRWAHVLYPCDFLDLCARRGP